MNFQEEVMNKPIKVEKVIVMGLRRTKEHVVLREMFNLKRSGTLEEVKDSLLHVHADLMGLDIFEAVDLSIAPGSKSPDGCTIVARLKESNLLGFHSGTYVQGTEGTVEASLNLTNPIGHAEQVSVGLEYGTQRTNLCSVTYSIPKPWDYNLIGDVRVHQLVTDREPWSSYVERLRGGIVTATSEDGQHAVSYELGWRRLSDPSRHASRSTMHELGDHVKSSLKYSFSTNHLDDRTFPRNGWSMRASTEIAGLGWDPKFLRFTKHQFSGQMAFPVGEDAALHIEGGAGLVLPWGGQRTSISDRFFLGGVCPDGLRGFKLKGVGPSDGRRPLRPSLRVEDSEEIEPPVRADALGGDIAWSLLAALRFNLPFESLQAAGLRGQVFLNCGNLSQLESGRSFGDVMNDFLGRFRCSMGAGIIWPTPIGRLEINLAQVLKRHDSDQIRTGLQFGFTTTI